MNLSHYGPDVSWHTQSEFIQLGPRSANRDCGPTTVDLRRGRVGGVTELILVPHRHYIIIHMGRR